MSKLVLHRPRLAHIQADITAKKKIYETVLKYSQVCGGGGQWGKGSQQQIWRVILLFL
jgi:hypothetical protein